MSWILHQHLGLNTIKFVETHYTDLRDSMIGESTENDSM